MTIAKGLSSPWRRGEFVLRRPTASILVEVSFTPSRYGFCRVLQKILFTRGVGRRRRKMENLPEILLQQNSGTTEKVSAPHVVGLPGLIGGSIETQKSPISFDWYPCAKEPCSSKDQLAAEKNLVAQAVHRFSPRASRPFHPQSRSHSRSPFGSGVVWPTCRAFTGALQARTGRMEAAHGGTLFLMKSARCRLRCRPKSCVFWNPARSSASEKMSDASGCSRDRSYASTFAATRGGGEISQRSLLSTSGLSHSNFFAGGAPRRYTEWPCIFWSDWDKVLRKHLMRKLSRSCAVTDGREITRAGACRRTRQNPGRRSPPNYRRGNLYQIQGKNAGVGKSEMFLIS